MNITMKIQYEKWNPNTATLRTLSLANEIILDYGARGYSLTLRQLYYRLVAKDIIANTKPSYKRLGSILTKARNAGMIDWNAIEDRTRGRKGLSTWDDPQSIVKAAIDGYRIDMWQNQPYRVFVWVEKEALAGVIERACYDDDFRVDYVCCRGYMSASTIWEEGRHYRYISAADDQIPIILHLADHDPSGLDMTRDNIERIAMYSELDHWWKQDEIVQPGFFHYERIALNKDQIEEYDPPPNFAKVSDSRYEEYYHEHGDESWELDALDPDVLVELVQEHIHKWRDEILWQEMDLQENEDKLKLEEIVEDLHDD